VVAPAESGEKGANAPTVEWNSGETATSYAVQLSTSEDLSHPITDEANLTDTTFQVSGLMQFTRYYWRVKAENEYGDGDWSEVWEFTTVGLPPGKVVLVSPSNSQQDVDNETTLEWNSIETAISYSLQLATSQDFTTLVTNEENLADTTFQVFDLVNKEGNLAKNSSQTSILDGLTTYFWRVKAVNAFGDGDWSDTWGFTTRAIVSNEVESGIPEEFNLSQNYPNPFNPATTINFDLPESGEVTLQVFDLLGREVAMLVQDRMDAGYHKITFDASSMASGIYIYRLVSGKFSSTRKMLLIK